METSGVRQSCWCSGERKVWSYKLGSWEHVSGFQSHETGPGHLRCECRRDQCTKDWAFPWSEQRRKASRGDGEEQPVRRRARNMLKVNRRKYLGGERDQWCHVTWEVVPTIVSWAGGVVFLPGTPGHCFWPSEQAASMCLMGTTPTIVNQKDVWDVFSRGWRQNGPSVSSINRGCVCLCVRACSVVSNSLWSPRLWHTRLLCPWNFPDKNTGAGCHFLLQRVFHTQGSNLRELGQISDFSLGSHESWPFFFFFFFSPKRSRGALKTL